MEFAKIIDMGIGFKLIRLLSLFACLSLILAGGNWVHDAHASNVHFHAEAELAPNDHPHYDDGNRFDGASFDSWIHCGSDQVWTVDVSKKLTFRCQHARGEITDAAPNPIWLQVEKPPPRCSAVT